MGSDFDFDFEALDSLDNAETVGSNALTNAIEGLEGLNGNMDDIGEIQFDSTSISTVSTNEPAEKKRRLEAALQNDSHGLQPEHDNVYDYGIDANITLAELQPATATADDQITRPHTFASSSPEEMMSSDSDTLDIETGLPSRVIHAKADDDDEGVSAASHACEIIQEAMVHETLDAVRGAYGSQDGQDENVFSMSQSESQLAQLLEGDSHQPELVPSESDAQLDSMKPPVQIGLAQPSLKESWEDAPVQAWRHEVTKILTQNGFDSVQWKRPLRLASLCSGLQTAHLGMSHLGVPFVELYAADLKDSCMKAAQNMQALPCHFFNSICDAHAQEGWCKVHAKVCRCEDTARPDLLVAGFPCAPYSTQRPQRFSSGAGSWRSHPEVGAMWETADHIRHHRPYFAILENVQGFLRNTRTAIIDSTTHDVYHVCMNFHK